jgi:hypothetical protein
MKRGTCKLSLVASDDDRDVENQRLCASSSQQEADITSSPFPYLLHLSSRVTMAGCISHNLSMNQWMKKARKPNSLSYLPITVLGFQVCTVISIFKWVMGIETQVLHAWVASTSCAEPSPSRHNLLNISLGW